MKFKKLHDNFKLPTKGTAFSGAYDLYMPVGGVLFPDERMPLLVPLGFAAEVPEGCVALILPRSGMGARGLMLNNTCGVIDSDYRGEWQANLRNINNQAIEWVVGQRLLQMLIIPILRVQPTLYDELTPTERESGGFGSTGE